MCGIIGYVGKENALPKITEGLSVLEYRGYDSVGLAAKLKSETAIIKCKGRIEALKELLIRSDVHNSNCAIGHTRWATHGGPSDVNAHPHLYGKTVIVHNGIIENYKDLQKRFSIETKSETDTEIAVAVIDYFYRQCHTPVKAIKEAVAQFEGSYAFGVMFEDIPDEIFAVRQGSPLLIANSSDGNYISSDLTAVLSFTNRYFSLDEGDVARISAGSVEIIKKDGSIFVPEWKTTPMTPESAKKGGYEHFMLKEINEQPSSIVNSIKSRIKDGLPSFDADGIADIFWREITNIQIVACGSAIHSGIAGGKIIEKLANIPTNTYIASEYRYDPPMASKGTLVLLISQSGETADTLAALRYAKKSGLPTLAIVNAVETTIARESDHRIYTYAGPEIAVATTKGYCTQLTELYFLAITMGINNGSLSKENAKEHVASLLEDAPKAVSAMLKKDGEIREIAKDIYNHEHVFYIGRGMDYAMSLEAALKLKEISYIHCEAYAAGELKHGTISLIESGTPVIAIATSDDLFEKVESNIREVKSRGAYVILICNNSIAKRSSTLADKVISLPSSSLAASLFASMTAVQLLAYETAVLRGCDIDRPRNLAKSVTVE